MFYLIFEFTIFFILFFTAYWMYLIVHSFFVKKNKKNTRIVRISLIAILVIIFATIFYGSFIEPQMITVRNVPVNLNTTDERETVRIAFLTDLHVGPYKGKKFVERLVEKTLAEKPDYIVFGGDYIIGKEIWSLYLEPLERFKADYAGKMFAVTGNHEFSNKDYSADFLDKTGTIRKMFAEYGIKILDNQAVLIQDNGSEFYIAGVKDLWTEQADAAAAIEQMENKNLPKILISHNPDIILNPIAAKFNLILSGHTHGGQIRLPFIGSVPPIPDEIGRAYDKGLFELNGNQLYISPGLSETGPRARLFNPPELTIIDLDL